MTSATNSDPGGPAAPGPSEVEHWTLTALVRRHRRATGVSIALVLAVVAVTILTTVSHASRQPLSDSANCSQWAAATSAQKIAYSHVYIEEYGRYANTASRAAAVTVAINRACTEASYLGESDDLSILAGLRHSF
jgi:Flp pilus assembly pilin Flp